jgi:hypothetical protein
VRRKTVTQQFEKEGVKVKLSGFEAWACERRGEIYFEPGGGEKVARAVNCLFALALGERRHKGRVSANLS